MRKSDLLEEGSNDELKQILASLPKDKGFAYNHYLYHGFWYSAAHLQGVLNCQSHFKPLDSDILLVTSPKSGTTWLKALLFTVVNRPADTLESLSTRNPHDIVPYLEIRLYKDSSAVPDLSTLTSRPRLFASHMPTSALPTAVWDSGCKIVYLCRDPRDMFISLWHFGKRLRGPGDPDVPLEEAFETFCKGTNGFGPLWDHVLGYWKKSLEMPSRVLLIKYEDLKADAPACLRQLADFLGFPFSEDEEKQGVVGKIVELCDFEHLSNLEVNKTGTRASGLENNAFFRRGKVGDSLNYLTPEMTARFDNIIKDKFHASGFNYY